MERKGNNKKKVLLVAAGLTAAGALTLFAMKRAKASNSSGSPPSAEEVVKPKKPLLRKKKTAPSANTYLPSATAPSVPATTPRVKFNPEDLAKSLRDAVDRKDVTAVLSVLRQMNSTDDYYLVNKVYVTLRFYGFNKTIVTDLLASSFESDNNAKALFRKELLRMGLKQSATGTWSLSGLKLHKDVVTITDTYVVDAMKRKIPVRKNTILGEELTVANGMTWFVSIDGSTNSVPTANIRYV